MRVGMRCSGCGMGIGVMRIILCLIICFIPGQIFGQDLITLEYQLQQVKGQLEMAVKEVSAKENALQQAYEEKNRAQLYYDNAGFLKSAEASGRLDEATRRVSTLEDELKKAKKKRSKLRVARKKAEESLSEEKWNQHPRKQKEDAEKTALAERAKSAGESVEMQREIERSNEDYREHQQWSPHHRNATDGKRLMEELTGTNDDYFNKDDKSVGKILSDSLGLEGKASLQDPAHQARHVTFDKEDLLNAMSDAERQDFLDRRKELKELQEDGRSLKKGSAGRKVVLERFEAKKKEFEKKFLSFRGFRGKTVTVYGDPPPTKKEIMEMVMGGLGSFENGDFGYGLSPYWKREASGAIVGLDSPPTFKTPQPENRPIWEDE